MRRLLLALVVSLAATAAAERVEPETPSSRISAALAAGRFSDAKALAAGLTPDQLRDPETCYWAAATAMRLLRYPEALRLVGIGLAANPEDIDLLQVSAEVRFALGDEAGAIAAANRALAKHPKAEGASGILSAARIVEDHRSGKGPVIEPGSREALAARFIDALSRGDAKGAATMVDPRAFAAVPGMTDRSRASIAHAIAQLMAQHAEIRGKAKLSYLGWQPLPTAPDPEGGVVVLVVLERSVSEQDIIRRIAQFDDPATRDTVDPTSRQLFAGLTPEDRAALAKDAAQSRDRVLQILVLHIAGVGEAMQVEDLVVDGVSFKKQLAPTLVLPPARRASLWERVAASAGRGALVGGIVGALGAIGVALWRARRRRQTDPR